ncbi:MAG: Murein DD-endopeptidase MepM and murein hydrolase activator NlpD, containing LysM domain [Chloroflexi bacterium]|nr:MAG: Murein DD-endopeptidase MepM and murein hydrolase activator NlpD, containing LysM domain [Chloroflexota bacterium]
MIKLINVLKKKQVNLRAINHVAIALFFILSVLVFYKIDIKIADAVVNLEQQDSLQFRSYAMPDYIQNSNLEAVTTTNTTISGTIKQSIILTGTDETQKIYDNILSDQRDVNLLSKNIKFNQPNQIPKYFRYEVQSGDSINLIANKFSIDANYIFWNNIHLTNQADLIQVGEMIRVPSTEGVLHDVSFGETLSEISNKYNAKPDDIVDFAANNINDPNFIEENVTILIVGGKQIKEKVDVFEIAANNIVKKESSIAGFVWPSDGPITSLMTWWHATGIDIGSPYNSPVVATNGGTVIFAGGDPCCSYGLYVDIRHPGGYVSRVGHLNKIWVNVGQAVQRGEIVGLTGSTGRSTGPHVHFELRRNGQLQNPLNYIPRTNLTFCDFC